MYGTDGRDNAHALQKFGVITILGRCRCRCLKPLPLPVAAAVCLQLRDWHHRQLTWGRSLGQRHPLDLNVEPRRAVERAGHVPRVWAAPAPPVYPVGPPPTHDELGGFFGSALRGWGMRGGGGAFGGRQLAPLVHAFRRQQVAARSRWRGGGACTAPTRQAASSAVPSSASLRRPDPAAGTPAIAAGRGLPWSVQRHTLLWFARMHGDASQMQTASVQSRCSLGSKCAPLPSTRWAAR